MRLASSRRRRFRRAWPAYVVIGRFENREGSYWDRCGRTFEDLDGYRVVLQNAAWIDDVTAG